MLNSRQIAFLVLRDIDRKGAFTDLALDKWLRRSKLSGVDRKLAAELVYGCVRRQRSLDAIVDGLAKKKASQQPPDLRLILQLGLYQLCYVDRIPKSAAVHTTVELAKTNNFAGLAGFVNGLLRQYIRLQNTEIDPGLKLPENPVERLGILHSYPNWTIENWIAQIGLEETEQLCKILNQSPTIHLRVNPLRNSLEAVESALQTHGIQCDRVPHFPLALKLSAGVGEVPNLPGFSQGWWTVQDSSAQLVGYLLDPQPGEMVVDACSAPGGKSTHIAELMGDRGTVWACDRAASRLKKVQQNVHRLSLQSIKICQGDSRNLPQFANQCDRVLLDAPCSGLGTLHRRADLRWRQTPETTRELSQLQGELLEEAASWVKPGGVLVYATCTLHPPENQEIIQTFLDRHPQWQIDPPSPDSLAYPFVTPHGWIEVWPHRHQMDGFFMVRLNYPTA